MSKVILIREMKRPQLFKPIIGRSTLSSHYKHRKIIKLTEKARKEYNNKIIAYHHVNARVHYSRTLGWWDEGC